MIEPCEDPRCACRDHIDSATHVPCCPIHNLPLVLSEQDGYGRCLAAKAGPVVTHIGGQRFQSKTCREWKEDDWRWLPSTAFSMEDLPPHNGWQAPKYEREGKRFRIDVIRRCQDCAEDTPHLDVGHTSICLSCGFGRWIA